jgi:hypothetical protein
MNPVRSQLVFGDPFAASRASLAQRFEEDVADLFIWTAGQARNVIDAESEDSGNIPVHFSHAWKRCERRVSQSGGRFNVLFSNRVRKYFATVL